MVREIVVQFLVEGYQRLKKWYLMPPCLTLSIIRYGSRVNKSNPGNGVAPSSTHQCSSYWRESLRVTLDYGHQLYLLIHLQSFALSDINFVVFSKHLSLTVSLAEGQPHLLQKSGCPNNHTKLHLQVRTLFGNFREWEIYLRCHYCLVHSEGCFLFRVLSMG